MLLQPDDITTENSILCTTADCGNQSWAFNVTSNISWSDYKISCRMEPHPDNFSTSPKFHSLVYVMYGIIFFVALFGNGLVCLVVKQTPAMQTVTNYFIVNLAVGDILMTILCVPFSFVSMLILRYWPFGGILCKVVNYSQAVSVFVSAYTMLAISIDRYIAITRPLKPRLEKNVAKMVLAAVWCGAVFTAAPIAIVSQLNKPTVWHEFCKVDICSEQWADAEQNQQYTYALLTLQFLLPLAALVSTYSHMACVVWRVRPPGEAQLDRDLRMHSSKRKMLKMMVTVIMVFTICWLPLNIFIILWNMYSEEYGWSLWPSMPYVWFTCHWLAMSHCCYNPIIYCYMNSRYRRGFKQMLASLACVSCKETSRSTRRSLRHSDGCEGLHLAEIRVNSRGYKLKSASTGELAARKSTQFSMKQE